MIDYHIWTASGGTIESWGRNVEIIMLLFLTKNMILGHKINFFFQVESWLLRFSLWWPIPKKVVGYKTKGHWKLRGNVQRKKLIWVRKSEMLQTCRH